MDKSISFYRNLFDMKLTERHAASEIPTIPVALAFLRNENNHHDLVITHDPDKTYRTRNQDDLKEGLPGFHHFAYEYPDRGSWLEQLEKVKALGFEIVRGPIVHSPWHARGEGSWGENESFYVLDPDGHRVEMFCDMGTVEKDGTYTDACGDRIEGPIADEF